jgi:outer membrane protein TolC
MTSLVARVCIGLVIGTSTATAMAQIDPVLTFEEASVQLLDVSHALKAAQSALASKRDTADSLDSLGMPTLSIDAEWLRYRKTLNDSQNVRVDNSSVNGVPANVGGLGNTSFDATLSQTAVRSALTATWPLYTGGEIAGTQRAARAIVDQANAALGSTRDVVMLELVRVYYGQSLAERVVELKRQLRNGMQDHLDHARRMEHHGMLTRAQRLQAQVALNAAQRGYETAVFELDSARIALSALLQSAQPIRTGSPLFMLTALPLGERDSFVEATRQGNAQLQQLDAMRRAADENVTVARARWQPKVFAFGLYNLNRNGETPLDPDWLAGLGVSWPLFASIDRAKSVSAASHASSEARSALDDVRSKLDAATRQAFDAVQDARRQFSLLEADLAAATENMRVQEIAFREGQGTSTDVTDARVALTAVLVEQAAAAYRFDVQLAQLLQISGQIQRYTEFASHADKVIP